MICPVCQEQGVTSTVEDRGTGVWCLGYFPYHDEQGVVHHHNPNRHETFYRCSRGHKFLHRYYRPCPSCGHREGPESVMVLPTPESTAEAKP